MRFNIDFELFNTLVNVFADTPTHTIAAIDIALIQKSRQGDV